MQPPPKARYEGGIGHRNGSRPQAPGTWRNVQIIPERSNALATAAGMQRSNGDKAKM